MSGQPPTSFLKAESSCWQAIRELAGAEQLQARLDCKQAVCERLRGQLADAQALIADLQSQPAVAARLEQGELALSPAQPEALQEQLQAAHMQVRTRAWPLMHVLQTPNPVAQTSRQSSIRQSACKMYGRMVRQVS